MRFIEIPVTWSQVSLNSYVLYFFFLDIIQNFKAFCQDLHRLKCPLCIQFFYKVVFCAPSALMSHLWHLNLILRLLAYLTKSVISSLNGWSLNESWRFLLHRWLIAIFWFKIQRHLDYLLVFLPCFLLDFLYGLKLDRDSDKFVWFRISRDTLFIYSFRTSRH